MKKIILLFVILILLTGCAGSTDIKPSFDCRECEKDGPCPSICDEPTSYPEPDYWGR